MKTVALFLLVLFVVGCNSPAADPPKDYPTEGFLTFQAGVTFTGGPLIAYLYADFYIDGTWAAHIDSAASGTGGSDSRQYVLSLLEGTYSIESSGDYGTTVSGGGSFTKSPVSVTVVGGGTSTYQLLSSGGSVPTLTVK